MALIPALSGYEERMGCYLSEAVAPFVSEVTSDSLGNVIARIDGRNSSGPRVMVFAHMDQLGFVVRKISPSGLIQIERLGGIPEKVLPGLRVTVISEVGRELQGVIGVKSHHATKAEEKYTVTPYSELYVDLGVSSAEEIEGLGVEVGNPVVYEPRFAALQGDRVSATSVDDRGGCSVLVKLAEYFGSHTPESTIYLVGTVQEEFNLRGALVAANQIQPDAAISLDIFISCDTPDLTERSSLKLGGGPVMGMYTFHGRGTLNGTIPHPALVRLFQEAARSGNIPLQRSANLGSLTDSSYVQLVNSGVPCIDLGFATRYTHTPVEVCDLADLEALYSLLVAGLSSVGPDFDFSRRPVPTSPGSE
jgi:putative aminopeptidase FrvX